MSEKSTLSYYPPPIGVESNPDAILSASELLYLHDSKINRVPLYCYCALKIESVKAPWIHKVRFCRDWNIWGSKFIDCLFILKEKGIIDYEQHPNRREYRISFLLEDEL